MPLLEIVDENGVVVEGFDVNPFSWLGSAAEGAFGGILNKAGVKQKDPEREAAIKKAVAAAKAKKKAEAEAKSWKGKYNSAKEAASKAVAKAKEDGRYQNMAIGAGIGAGAIGLLVALVKR